MHLVLVTKYRKKIIDKGILQRLQEILAHTCEQWRANCLMLTGSPTTFIFLRGGTPPSPAIPSPPTAKSSLVGVPRSLDGLVVMALPPWVEKERRIS
ncbi:MAG: hypothetical protein EBV05_02995 [Cyanobacteria bacterium WB6_1B_304]|nr:hypothetical protein [Cyanobacteria bacterium WB6_1B_304]